MSVTVGSSIWVTGKISSRVYNSTTKDSVLYDERPFQGTFSVMKLIHSNADVNSVGGIEDFKIINSLGYSFPEFCEISDIIAQSVLNSDCSYHRYKIGFVPLQVADYVFKFRNTSLKIIF